MANPNGARNLYLNKENSEALQDFTADELRILVVEGRGLFELTMSSPTAKEMEYLNSHPKLMKVVEKW